jgi:L-2-amino-thiazoline-4-carboxylic acid hydrolase-like protein
VLCALRAEFGKHNADAIMKQALRDWSRQLFGAIGDGIAGSSRRKWATVQSAWTEVSVKDVQFEIRRHDKEALEFDVTHCRYAEFFRALGEPELGTILICEADFDITAAGVVGTFVQRSLGSPQSAAPLVIFGTRAILPCSRIRRPRWTGHNFHPH